MARGDVTPFSTGSTTTGSAEVVSLDGTRKLDVDLSGMPRSNGAYVQTWLFDPKTNDMIAVGVMDQDSESFPIPASVDLDTYTSVDISLEPLDGNPAHSATSLARRRARPPVVEERAKRASRNHSGRAAASVSRRPRPPTPPYR